MLRTVNQMKGTENTEISKKILKSLKKVMMNFSEEFLVFGRYAVNNFKLHNK